MSIATKLRRLRKAKDIRLQQVADATKLTKPHVWEMERGSPRGSNPTINTLRSLAKYYGVTVAFLIGEKS